MTADFYGPFGNKTVQKTFCNSSCGTSLDSYRVDVAKSCAKDPQPFDGLPSNYWVDYAKAVWNLLCLTDSTSGAYCTDVLNTTFASSNVDQDISSLPKSELCQSCIYKVFSQMQSTPYSNYDSDLAESWSSVQSTCRVSYPTSVPELQTNVTTPGGFADPYSPPPCLSGNYHTVASGDNCLTIAHNFSVSTGSLITLNNLYPDCSNLVGGVSLCIPPSCKTYTVRSNDTCDAISNSTSTTFQQLVGWNPTINSYCTNLITGQDVCVTPPGGAINLTTVASATVTQTAVYAASTVPPPGPVASGTTRDCGKWHEVQAGDYCQLVALNFTIDLGLFLNINPSLNSKCTNLVTGEVYCVMPTADWNSTNPSAIVSPPAATPSGTTSNCYMYYVIKSGDYCGLIENEFAITFAQLQSWNPSISDDCGNLVLNEAYCVNGGSLSNPTTTAADSKATKAKDRRVDRAGPYETGVPYGWPGLNSLRMQMDRDRAARALSGREL